jgi:hypothetical protein
MNAHVLTLLRRFYDTTLQKEYFLKKTSKKLTLMIRTRQVAAAIHEYPIHYHIMKGSLIIYLKVSKVPEQYRPPN